MSVQLFKGSEDTYVQPDQIQSYLDTGWSLEDPNYKGPIPPETFYPKHLRNVESLPEKEGEDLILLEMGLKKAKDNKPAKRKYNKRGK